MRRLIRAGCGALLAAVVAAGFGGEVAADETARVEDATPVAKPDSRLASSVGDSRPPASARMLANRPSRAETNEIEGIRSAAEDGVARAQFSLGLRYESGRGVAKDPVQAIHWFCKAAEQGYDEAQYTLGCCYNGDKGFAKDPSEAAKWWGKAAAQGYADAQYCLGLSYFMGLGVAKNPAAAAKWWSKAAEQGHADAQYFLGLSYSMGLGVPKIPEQAVFWLRNAVALGHENALAALNKLRGKREISAER